ncbi:nuclear transport factor 2 family protein [Nocardioides campestrisoli]|uniref:nuclear transport factor 2 family protein n=1 Tax=Nocardioides campestrisoli TaxID=2736757 RepID=UPI0015E79B15|nr:nuclear transport factor 2 family protein [Nocardioides campestrisoli]
MNGSTDDRLEQALDRLQRLEDTEAARNHLHAYAETLDDPTPEAVAALFTEDGVLEVPSGSFEGRAEITEFYRSRLTPEDGEKRHFLVNLRTRHLEPGLVEVASYFVYTSREDTRSALGWGTYTDQVRVTDGAAGFRRKRIAPHVHTDLVAGWPRG